MAGNIVTVSLMIITILFVKESSAFQLCPKSTPEPNSTVQFAKPHDLVTEIFGCLQEALEFQCCMTSYKAVQWFQFKHGVWHDFMDSITDRSLGEDDNQTAILMRAWDHGYDNGTFKCIGYGVSPGDIVSHELNVSLKACPRFGNFSPIPFIPENPVTPLKRRLTENVNVTCGAIFGLHCGDDSSATHCTTNWTKIGDHVEPIPEGSDNSTRRIYFETDSPITSMNDQTSTLYIFDISGSDFGTYVCSMKNKFGTTVRTIILSEKDKVIDRRFQGLGAVVLCCVCVVLLTTSVAYWRRWDVRIMWIHFKQRFSKKNGDYILLLHTSSGDIDKSFAIYCSEKLQEYHFNVVIGDDICGGQDVISEWLRMSRSSSVVIVLVSPDFLADRDQLCLLPLRSIIRCETNIVFLLLNVKIQSQPGFCQSGQVFVDRSIDDPDPMILSEDVNAAIRWKENVDWPIAVPSSQLSKEIWKNLEISHRREVTAFWEKLICCLPQQSESDPLLPPGSVGI